MNFDPRDYDSRDDQWHGNTPNRGNRGASDDCDRDDDWSHTYQHLSPLVSRLRARRRRPQKWDERGDATPHSVNPSLNPVP